MTTTHVHQRQHAPTATRSGQIVVGVNGTYAAGEALAWATRLAQAASCDVTAVYAWRPGLGDSVGARRREAERQRARELQSWCEPVRHAAIAPRLTVREGEACDVLATMSCEPDVRLLVVGRAGRGSGLAHDTDHQADRIARATHRPLAIVPSPGGGRSVERIIVGLDGSPAADAACAWAAWLATAAGADVVAVTAFEPLLEWVPSSSPNSSWAKVRAELEGRWTAPLRANGLVPTAEVVEGSDYVGALTRVARERHADAIVVGTSGPAGRRHHRGIGGIRLFNRCQLPVFLVPVGPTPRAAPADDQEVGP